MKLSDIIGLIEDFYDRSWEEAIPASERTGGPSPMGNSKWQVFKTCPYLYQLMFIRRYRPKRHALPLEVGGLFHELMAQYFLCDMKLRAQGGLSEREIWERSKSAAFELGNRVLDVTPGVAGEAIRLFKAWQVLNGYKSPYYDCADTMFIENLAEVREPWHYSARFDRVRRSPKGGVILQDHKTTAKLTERLVTSYKIEPQFIGQFWLWNRTCGATYGEIDHIEVNLVTKTAEVRCEPIEVRFDDSTVKDWEYEMKDLNRELLYRMRSPSRRWPRRRSYQCQDCVGFDHCVSGGSLSGWTRKARGEW